LGDISCNCDSANAAYAINDYDQVTGNLRTNDRGIIYHAFLWSPDMNRPRDLGTVAGAQDSIGYGMNNLARIVGGSFATSDFTWQPLVWAKQSGMRLLGVIPDAIYTQANAINDAGEIIGYGFTSTDTFAFYKGPHSGLKFLEGLGSNANYAEDINQLGMIVGTSEITEGTVHAVLWSSATSTPQDLGTLTGVGSSSARGINNLEQVIGESFTQ
jgi:probable HAF family extracellular repeat protein